jgi:hypothetical protein
MNVFLGMKCPTIAADSNFFDAARIIYEAESGIGCVPAEQAIAKSMGAHYSLSSTDTFWAISTRSG